MILYAMCDLPPANASPPLKKSFLRANYIMTYGAAATATASQPKKCTLAQESWKSSTVY